MLIESIMIAITERRKRVAVGAIAHEPRQRCDRGWS
jgi:hypothetical protein